MIKQWFVHYHVKQADQLFFITQSYQLVVAPISCTYLSTS